MEKDGMKDLLFKILKEKDTMFSDVTMDDSQEQIIVKLIHGKSFSLTIQPYMNNIEESLLQWFRENPISLTMEFMMIYLVESEIIDLETARGYMKEIALRANELQEKYSDRWF